MVDYIAMYNLLDFECIIYCLNHYVLNSVNQIVKWFNFCTFYKWSHKLYWSISILYWFSLMCIAEWAIYFTRIALYVSWNLAANSPSQKKYLSGSLAKSIAMLLSQTLLVKLCSPCNLIPYQLVIWCKWNYRHEWTQDLDSNILGDTRVKIYSLKKWQEAIGVTQFSCLGEKKKKTFLLNNWFRWILIKHVLSLPTLSHYHWIVYNILRCSLQVWWVYKKLKLHYS